MSMFATATLLLVSVITTESSPLICMYIMSIESDHAYFVIVLITCVFLICHVFVHKIQVHHFKVAMQVIGLSVLEWSLNVLPPVDKVSLQNLAYPAWEMPQVNARTVSPQQKKSSIKVYWYNNKIERVHVTLSLANHVKQYAMQKRLYRRFKQAMVYVSTHNILYLMMQKPLCLCCQLLVAADGTGSSVLKQYTVLGALQSVWKV